LRKSREAVYLALAEVFGTRRGCRTTIMSGTAQDALPMSLPSSPRSVTGPHQRPVTGPQPRVAITTPPISDEEAVRAFRASVAPPSVRSAAPSTPAALLKAWSDRVPFPFLFVLGAVFGVIFATSLVSIMKPKPQAVASSATVFAAPVQQQSAPFVAWAAPPAMPTAFAEPQLPKPAVAAPRAPAARHAKRAVTRTSRRGGVANANTLTAAL